MTHIKTGNLAYEFGPYRLDFTKCILTRAGEIISLPPKATQILMLLVAHAGELLEKDELLKEVWPDTFVEEANLTQNIFMLRRALGDERAHPRYIETVVRRGYRFIAPVRTLGADENETADAEESVVSHRPVVAVLPFLNTTGDQQLEYLAEGITDNIINNLSRVPRLRVMSRSTVFRYCKANELDPQKIGTELGTNTVLIGKINSCPTGIVIAVELVDVAAGWQLWGESFDSNSKDLLEIQGTITRQLLAALKLRLTGEEEKRVTARYTENAQAYEAYLEGRYHWSRYTKKGIEKAIRHFRDAFNLDPNYALAYAGIVDCYLRLATKYLPPEENLNGPRRESFDQSKTSLSVNASAFRMKLRFEWDWKGAERELRRANDLKSNYPAAHQWYAAYRRSKQIYQESISNRQINQLRRDSKRHHSRELLPLRIASLELTPSEQIQVYCPIVREQIDVGNYDAGCRILRPWWSLGSWPKLDGLSQQSCADLLFTAGELAGFMASSVQLTRGQKHGEELLHGSVALFEQLGLKGRAAEGRIELALCYHRQGLFDMGRLTLLRVLDDLSEDNWDLRSLALMRLGSLERNAGHLKDALTLMIQASDMAQLCGPWITARCHLELASIYKDLAISEDVVLYSEHAKHFYSRALQEFQAIGNHRYAAIVENNMGLLQLNLGFYEQSEKHLLRSRRFFENFSDSLRRAQVNETLARLYIETKRYEMAQDMIEQCIGVFEIADGETLLAEALTTSGILSSRLGRFNDAKKSFETAYKLSERCGDNEGAGLAFLTMLEEIGDRLDSTEKIQIAEKLKGLLMTTQQTTLIARVQKFIADIPQTC